MTLAKQTARAVAWNQAAKIVEMVGGLAASVLLARLLAKEAYGVYGLALATVGILALAADLGVRETFGKFLPEVAGPERRRFIVRRFLLWRLVLVTVATGVLLGGLAILAGRRATPIMAGEGHSPCALADLAPYAALVAAILAGRVVFTLFEAYSLSTLRVRGLALARIGQTVLWIVSLVAMWRLGWWGLGPVLAVQGALVALAALALAAADREAFLGRVEAVPMRGVVRFGAAIWATLLVNVGVEHGIDAVLLGALASSAAEVARYTVGIALAVSLFGFLVSATSAVYLPSLSAARAEGGPARLAEARTAYVKVMAAAVPPLALLFVLAPEILTGLYGPAYATSAPVLRVMCLALGLVALVGGGVNANTLLVLGRSRLFFWSRLAAGTLNVAGDILLIPPWGALGAAVATAGTIVGLHLFDLGAVRVLTGAGLPGRFLLRVCGGTGAAATVLVLATHAGPLASGTLWHVAGASVAYAVAIVIFWALAQPLDLGDREGLARIHPVLGRLAGPFAVRRGPVDQATRAAP